MTDFFAMPYVHQTVLFTPSSSFFHPFQLYQTSEESFVTHKGPNYLLIETDYTCTHDLGLLRLRGRMSESRSELVMSKLVCN